MTHDERHAALVTLDQILRDNAGNRITAALIVGIVNTLHDHMPVQQTGQQPPTPEPTP